jgi:hypothetical protein
MLPQQSCRFRSADDQGVITHGANQVEILPVVNHADVHKLEGVVTLQDVLDAYRVNRT